MHYICLVCSSAANKRRRGQSNERGRFWCHSYGRPHSATLVGVDVSKSEPLCHNHGTTSNSASNDVSPTSRDQNFRTVPIRTEVTPCMSDTSSGFLGKRGSPK